MERSKGFIIDDDPLWAELQEVARVATRSALDGYDVSEIPGDRLTVKQSRDGDYYVYELCLVGVRSAEDKVLASARVDPITKQAVVRVVGLERSRT